MILSKTYEKLKSKESFRGKKTNNALIQICLASTILENIHE